ncbi:hypothetical protein LZ31DRAFT_547286 [Colletotrichum somersetense]|nr:hypothetical protein LZ31DRAFT_547286 [Colletotrichum somersetense]
MDDVDYARDIARGRRQTALRTYSRRNQRGAIRKPSTVAAERNLSETSNNVTASTRMPSNQPEKRATKSVDLITYRASDGSKRLVPEPVLQQKAPQKVYAYWQSFDQPREATIGSHYFHIFNILDQKGSKLKVQWVGYTDSADDTTWDTAAKVRKMNPALLADYMAHHERARSTGTMSKPRKGRLPRTAIG